MDLSVTAATAYLPVQAYAQQAGARGQGATVQEQAAAAAEQAASARLDSMAISPEAQQARDEAARRKDPGAEVARNAGIRFEYQDNHQVMKVNNTKGYLIYQVPSKGQLALIQAEEAAQQPGRQIELTA